MDIHSNRIEILEADLVGDGVLIYFSTGATTLFHANFLYEIRDAGTNVPYIENPYLNN